MKEVSKKYLRYFFSVCVLFLFFELLVIFGLNILPLLQPKELTTDDILYNYNRNGLMDYKVYLKDNDFIKDAYLKDKDAYIAKMVDYILIDIDYKFKGDRDATLTYTYNLKGIMKSQYNNSNFGSKMIDLWVKEYNLGSITKATSFDKEFTIDKQLKVDLTGYNEEVKKFRDAYGVAIDPSLTIQININVKGTVNNKNFANNDVMYLNIPLDATVFKINGIAKLTGGQNIPNKTIDDASNLYMIYNVSGIVLVLLAGAIFIKKFLIEGIKSKYRLKFESIINEFGNRIVMIKNFIHVKEDDYVNIGSFNELIDLVDEINAPILCWIRHRDGIHETWFIVVNDKMKYRYILSPRNLD